MPLINKNGNVSIVYNLPKRKRNLMTKEFLETFKKELDNVFYRIDDYQPLEQRNYWNTYQYMEGNGGFNEAFKTTCKKHNLMKAIYSYNQHMSWYDGDIFDGEITKLMVERGVIQKGDVGETVDDFDYANDDDFELEVTKINHKGYTVITKDWIVKE